MKKEIRTLFQELKLTTEAERKQILLQGVIQPKEEYKQSMWVEADNRTFESKGEEKCARLEPTK
jgi:hypothetical protein